MADQPPSSHAIRPRRAASTARSGTQWPGRVAAVVLGFVSLLLVAWPVAAVTLSVLRSAAANGTDFRDQLRSVLSATTLVGTMGYAFVIGIGTIILAWPAAAYLASAVTASQRARRLALILTPLLLPTYLPYAGWGLLRGPNTLAGDWLARHDPSLTILVGKCTALGGMSLWAWPLAALVLASGRDALGTHLTDVLRLERLSGFRRFGVMAVCLRRSILNALLVVGLVIVGSAIPLHVAQVPTYAIELWKTMQLTPDPAGVWVASLPLVAIALMGALWLSRWLAASRAAPSEWAGESNPSAWAVSLAAIIVWGVAVLVPLGLFAWSLASWRSVPMFWRISGTGVAQSLRNGCLAGLASVFILLLTWTALDSGRRLDRIAARISLVVLAFAGMLPGVLVGAAANLAWGSADTTVIATHLCRFGWIAAAAGWWLARQEPREQRWLRLTEGGSWLRGWTLAAVVPRAPAIVGLGACIAALSVHEIESTVFVLPPGAENLAQQLLDYLHYARDEQLSAAAVNLLGSGVVAAGGAAWLVAWGSRAMNAPTRGGRGSAASDATDRRSEGSV